MTIPSILKIRELNVEDLFQIAEVHKNAFPDSALTKLGFEPIRRYYEWQLIGPHDCHATGAFDEQVLVGFCFAGSFNGALNGYLNKNKYYLFFWILSHPWLIGNELVRDRISIAFRSLAKKKSNRKNVAVFKPKSLGILSIAVYPTKQGCGIGKLLMDEFEVYAKQKGSHEIDLTVHKSNSIAVRFYENLGWVREVDSLGNWSGLMRKSI